MAMQQSYSIDGIANAVYVNVGLGPRISCSDADPGRVELKAGYPNRVTWRSLFHRGDGKLDYLPLSSNISKHLLPTESSHQRLHRLGNSNACAYSLVLSVLALVLCGSLIIVIAHGDTDDGYRSQDINPTSNSLAFHSSSLAECSPLDWSAGTWVLKDPLPDRMDDVLKISDFEACASSFAYNWHLGIENGTIGEYRRKASDYQYVPGRNCRNKPAFDKEALVISLVEQGGWMLIGDSLSEQQFFSISCMLYPHVRATPEASQWGRAKDFLGEPQYLWLAPNSSLIPKLTFPAGFDIAATPLVFFQRVDLLFDHQELYKLYSSLPPFSHASINNPPNQSALYGPDAFWDVPSATYLDQFIAPFPLNYRLLLVATAGHWTVATFNLGMQEVIHLFSAAVDRWIGLVESTLKKGRKGKEVMVRSYLGGHEDCFSSKGPLKEIAQYVGSPFNWPHIHRFNEIFQTAIDKASNPRITFLDIIRPAQLRPDSHTYWDCLHHAIGSGVIEGWTDYIAYYMLSSSS